MSFSFQRIAFPHASSTNRGSTHNWKMQSKALQGNYWNDPTERDVWVYLPPQYDAQTAYPLVVFLSGFAGTGEMMLNRNLNEASIIDRCDRWIADGTPPFIAVFPDCMTSLGGSQFVNSPAIGNYAQYIAEDLVEHLRKHCSITHIGLTGRSSGGYGAVRLAMEYPHVFSAVACHAGDMGFETAFLGELTQAMLPLHQAGSAFAFLERFWTAKHWSSTDFAAFNLLCMSAAYSPSSTTTLSTTEFPADIPIDFQHGSIKWEVFHSWFAHDPISLVDREEFAHNLQTLRYFFIDVGRFDEYNLQFGARKFSAKLNVLGVSHIYEEFDGGHRGTNYRYDQSIPNMVVSLG